MAEPKEQGRCLVCGRDLAPGESRLLEDVGPGVARLVREDYPDAPDGARICGADRARYRRLQVERLLQDEQGELSDLDREVLASLESRTPVAEPVAQVYEERKRFGDRAADAVAAFGGSWTFILAFVAVLVVWIALNVTGLLFGRFDPYPFILLNLALSCIAALQAPVIMMSQRRQEAIDRLRSENDYKVNLKAELEIRHLHEKIDHQLSRQWERLAEIQRIQIEMMEELMEAVRR